MALGGQDRTINAGASYTFRFTLKDEDGVTNLEPSADDVHYRIAPNAQSDQPHATIDAPDLTVTGNIAFVPIPHTLTKTLPKSQTLYHEVYLVEDGVRSVLGFGSLTVSPRQLQHHPNG